MNEHPETTAEAESLATGAGSADGTPAARRSAGGTPQRGRPVGHPGLCPPWVPALLSSTGSGRCGQTARGDTRVTQLRPAFLPPGNCYRDTYMRVIICIGDLFFFFFAKTPFIPHKVAVEGSQVQGTSGTEKLFAWTSRGRGFSCDFSGLQRDASGSARISVGAPCLHSRERCRLFHCVNAAGDAQQSLAFWSPWGQARLFLKGLCAVPPRPQAFRALPGVCPSVPTAAWPCPSPSPPFHLEARRPTHGGVS